MELSVRQGCYLITIFVMVVIFSIILQHSLLINLDVSWLVYVASLILDGGSYSKDFFEIAPPSTLLLYSPVALLSKLFSVSATIVLRTYVYFIGFCSLAICYTLIKKIVNKKDVFWTSIFLICFEFIFFVIPTSDFGQKEHLFLLFVMPYILLMACRAQGGEITRHGAIFIGFFSGLGIAMKPYFLLFPLFLELYYYLTSNKDGEKGKKWTLFFRPEVIAIFSVLLVYLVITYLFFPDYISVLVPYALRWNYASLAVPWVVFFRRLSIYICLYTVLLFIIQYQYNPYRRLTSVFVLALIASILSYLVQRNNFPYHWYPSYALNLLLIVFLLGLYVSAPKEKRPAYWMICFLIIFFIPYLFLFFYSNQELHPFFLAWYQNIVKVNPYYFFTFLIICFMGLFLGYKKTKKNFLHYMTSTLLMFLFLAIPFCNKIQSYKAQLLFNDNLKTIIAFTDKYALHRSTYFFSTLMEHAAIIDYCKDTKSDLRFPFLWMLPAMIKEKHDEMTLSKDKHFLTQMVTEDIHNKKPYLVFVDITDMKAFFYTTERNPISFDFLPFFLTDNDFKREWKHYHYFTTLNLIAVADRERKFAVYQRQKYR